MSTRTCKIISGFLATSILAGCSVGQNANDGIMSATNDASRLARQAAQPMPAANTSPIKVNEGTFVATKAIRNENGEPLPSKFEGSSGITLVRKQEASLAEIATAITQSTKIPVVIGASAPIPEDSDESNDFSLASGPVPEGFPLADALSQIQSPSSSGVITASPAAKHGTMRVDYEGPLSGLLDVISSYFNVAWRHEKGRIVIDTVITRSFDIPALSMSTELDFNLSSQSSQGGDGGAEGGAGQAAVSRTETNVLGEIRQALGNMIPDGEGSFDVNPTAGVVTITGTPDLVTRVSNYLKNINERLGEQIALSVKVYSVTMNNKEEFDLNVEGLLQEAGKFGLQLGTAGGGVVPAPGAVGPGLGWALLDPDSNWNGTNALVQALSTQGDVSVVTTASVTTLSGIPVPFQVGEERDYVRRVTVTPGTDGAEPTASIEPGSVSTGFSLQVNPRTERNGDVLVQYGINISELTGAEDGFDTFSTNGTTVQLRRISQRNFIQQARIPNNSTLVLAGFEQVRNEAVKRGVGKANFPLFGGGSRAGIKREIIVIAITPTVLKSR